LIDPSTAQFRLADNDSMMTTTRENLPPPDRALAEEMAKGRSDDDTIVVAKPHKGPLDKEIADLEHSAQKLKEPKEPLDR
jgi:hypothetical protein